MSVFRIDPLRGYGTNNDNFWTRNGGNTYIDTETGGRNGNGRISVASGHSVTFLFGTANEHDTICFGAPVYRNSGTLNWYFYSDALATQHVGLNFAADGSLSTSRSGGGTAYTAPAGTTLINAWTYVEFYVKLHDTTGFIKVYVNGTLVINQTNIDTKNGGTKTVLDSFLLNGSGGTFYTGENYTLNGAGTVGNAPLGDCKVAYQVANANGTTNNFAGTGVTTAGSTYQNIDDASASATDYNSGSNTGDIDLYNFTDIGAAPVGEYSVFAVAAMPFMSKSDVGTKQAAGLTRVSGANYEGSTVTLSNTNQIFPVVWEKNPATNALWTRSEVNAAEFGLIVK